MPPANPSALSKSYYSVIILDNAVEPKTSFTLESSVCPSKRDILDTIRGFASGRRTGLPKNRKTCAALQKINQTGNQQTATYSRKSEPGFLNRCFKFHVATQSGRS
jgi:hypothetical protein